MRHRSRLQTCLSLITVTALSFGSTIGAAHAAQDGTGTIRVEVVNADGPVPGASVSAKDVTATTDASGVATLTLPVGSAFVAVIKQGHAPAIAPVAVIAGGQETVRLVLEPAADAARAIVASTRAGRRVEDQAFPVTRIDRDRIEAAMLESPGDLVHLFDAVPGVRVQTISPLLGTANVRLWGLPGRYTRLLYDGAPLYFDRPGGDALLRISPMDLERVEIVKGGASSLVGSDALAGAVNLLPRSAGFEPDRELLFNQSVQGATDAVFWLSTPATGTWSSTFLFGGHRQEENDVDDDGWSDLPEYERIVMRPRVSWDNGRGRFISGVAGVTFEKREGGSALVREALETKTADGVMTGRMILDGGYVLAGTGMLFVQSRTRDFSDDREGDRLQTATIEITLRKTTTRHTWLAGIAADWYALRSSEELPTKYVSTRPGIFLHDDLHVAPWLLVSGSVRLDHHNLYGFQVSPSGSALVRSGAWSARVSGGRSYFTPRPLTEETEAAGLARLTIEEPLEVETALSVSADVMHTTDRSALKLTVFRMQIDDPAQVDRTTYTLRTESDPIVSTGVELSATARRAPFSLTGAYTYLDTRERDGRALALVPKHSGDIVAAAEGDRGRIAFDVSFTGEQRLDANPYRSTSESYVLVGLVGEYRFGRWGVFVNADNLTDVRQTDWDPIARPSRDVDGRWTVDAWAPLAGRLINIGLRVAF